MSTNRYESGRGFDANSGSCFVDPLVGRFAVADPKLVPENIAVCPECGCKLYWQVETDDGLNDMSLDCENDDIWDENEDGDCGPVHRYYQSDWQPAIDRVKAWIRSANVASDLSPESEAKGD